jgi:tetratricopeptide (TPR) repeat protein
MYLRVILLGLFLTTNIWAEERCLRPESESQAKMLAGKHFAEAQKLIKKGDLPNAVKEFLCSFKIYPHPNTIYNIAKVYEEMGDLEKSIEYFELYLKDLKDEKERQEISAYIKELKKKLPKTEEEEPQEIRKEEIKKEKEKSLSKILAPTKPEIIKKKKIIPPPSKLRLRKILSWSSIGVGGILTGIGIGFLALAFDRSDELRKSEKTWPVYNPEYHDRLQADIRDYTMGGYITIGIGFTALVGGVIVLIADKNYK